MLVKGRILTLLVGCSNQFVALFLYPFPDTELILGCPKQFWDLTGMFMTLAK